MNTERILERAEKALEWLDHPSMAPDLTEAEIEATGDDLYLNPSFFALEWTNADSSKTPITFALDTCYAADPTPDKTFPPNDYRVSNISFQKRGDDTESIIDELKIYIREVKQWYPNTALTIDGMKEFGILKFITHTGNKMEIPMKDIAITESIIKLNRRQELIIKLLDDSNFRFDFMGRLCKVNKLHLFIAAKFSQNWGDYEAC